MIFIKSLNCKYEKGQLMDRKENMKDLTEKGGIQ